ncbi:hypothetical protein JZM24_01585 [Candidatus Sodalis endolongispinus]|uniref:Uncharacterized protein n=1 Tax=Candidatus Sodalis endolongispinus TaxID=2812662 RepID=A0ABS5Y845_9GAMM|nr:hypothetical protein [Candidatus Sodalis endolongispinus]
MSVVPLDSVMYDPLAWIHTARFALPTSLDGIAQRSILNGMLISLYGLSLERPALPAKSFATAVGRGMASATADRAADGLSAPSGVARQRRIRHQLT